MSMIDLTGKKFGRLTAIEYAGSRHGGGALWKLSCECGAVVICDGANLRCGRTKSCGCLRAEGPRVRHGLSHTKTHNTWVGMRQRCENPSDPAFPHYGGRGISVCDRWKSFDNFLSDMGMSPRSMSIERIDNNAGYSPENCKWATQSEQVKNRRTSIIYEFDGQARTLKEWGDLYGIPYKAMHHRYTIGKRGHLLLAPLRVIARRAKPKA